MQLAKVSLPDGTTGIGHVQNESIHLFNLTAHSEIATLSDILASAQPEQLAEELSSSSEHQQALSEVSFLAPIDNQEVWAAGVTYQRSQQARREESKGAAVFYDLVYTADRPEIFFKATAQRVVDPLKPVRVRCDSNWSVPEPELTLVIAPSGKLVGFTAGNDMSARDIEGTNPLYLPQAKLYNQSCALGPVITLCSGMPNLENTTITLTIHRKQEVAFEGTASLSQLHRTFPELIEWLTRENSFPNGVLLMTGTGIVPPDEFTLQDGDQVTIQITGIGTLSNPVVKASTG